MLEARKLGHGRGGVFWQTQSSGKSFPMVFFAQKVLCKLAGNWTFVVATDRVELEDQIAKTFKATRRGERGQPQSQEHPLVNVLSCHPLRWRGVSCIALLMAAAFVNHLRVKNPVFKMLPTLTSLVFSVVIA